MDAPIKGSIYKGFITEYYSSSPAVYIPELPEGFKRVMIMPLGNSITQADAQHNEAKGKDRPAAGFGACFAHGRESGAGEGAGTRGEITGIPSERVAPRNRAVREPRASPGVSDERGRSGPRPRRFYR